MAAQTLETVKRIIVVMPNWLGDAVMAMAALRHMRQLYPMAHVAVLTPESLQDLYQAEASINQIFIWRESGKRNIRQMTLLVKMLREEPFDLAVLFTNSFLTALLIRLAGVRFRVGYAKEGRRLLLTHAVPFPRQHRQMHQGRQFLSLLFSVWGLSEVPQIDTTLRLDRSMVREARALIKQNTATPEQTWVALGISSAYGPAKDWSAERYRVLGEEIYKQFGAKSLLLGTAKDQLKARFIRRGLEDVFVDLTGRTRLHQALGLLNVCGAYVGNDSGMAHAAAALGMPTVVIFGSTSPQFTQPLGPRVDVLYAGLSCSPCFKRTCPLGTLQCMRDIKVSAVMEALEPYFEEMT